MTEIVTDRIDAEDWVTEKRIASAIVTVSVIVTETVIAIIVNATAIVIVNANANVIVIATVIVIEIAIAAIGNEIVIVIVIVNAETETGESHDPVAAAVGKDLSVHAVVAAAVDLVLAAVDLPIGKDKIS